MPNASSGNTISASAQVNTGVILTAAILDGTIINADISSSAAIAGSKIQALSVGANAGVIPSTGITTSHLAAAAGIVDTQLAQIVTAGKVSGAALTSLASIPVGAGIIPAANVASGTWKVQNVTKDVSEANATQTIAHGLGATPKFVRLTAIVSGSGYTLAIAVTAYDGTTQAGQAVRGEVASVTNDYSFRLNNPSNNNSAYAQGVVTFDGTNIYIAWTKTGAPTGTFGIMVEAYA